jgi:PKD repeat protein
MLRKKRALTLVFSMVVALVGIPASPVSAAAPVFRAVAESNANSLSGVVAVPGSVQAGDQLVLVVSANRATTIATPTGWTQLDTRQDGSLTSSVFTRTADGATAGSTVAADLGAQSKVATTLAAYAGAQPPLDALSSVAATSSTQLTSPSTNIADADSVVISYWANKTSDNTGWTVPTGVTERAASTGTGGGRVLAVIGDTIAPAGAWAGTTATSATAASKAIAWTIVLTPTTGGGGGNADPVAAFTSSCVLLDCTFDGTGSTDDGTIDTYAWNFGDGTADTGTNPTHTYTAAGTYTVTLTVTDDNGATDTTTTPITVTAPNQPPTAAFTHSCDDLVCTFDAGGSTDDGTIATFDWSFGDTASALDAGADVTHTYAGVGDYDVELTVTDNDGVGRSITVTITVEIIPNQDPVPAFTVDCDDLVCTFDAGGSTDDGTIVTYDWDFGDTASGSGVVSTHTYAASGDYTVELTVTDDDSVSVATSTTITVVIDPNQPPVAAFTPACDGLVCTFDGSGSSDDGTIVSFAWNFGDGDTATGAIPANNFPFPGTYVVSLTVTDDDAVTDTATTSLSVSLPAGAHLDLPPDVPRRDMPFIGDGEITDLDYLGDRVFVAGSFTSIRNNTGANTTSYDQPFLAAFDVNTGLVDTSFRPTFTGGGVTEIALSPDGTKMFVVGRFNAVNGVAKQRVAAIDPTTGATLTGFTANTNAAATAVAATNSAVYIGGQFTTLNGTPKVGLAAVSATTGQLVAGFQNDLTGGIGVDGAITVQALVLTPDLGRLLVVHTARQIAGQDRYGIGLIDTATNQLLPWRTRLWDDNLVFVGGIQRIYAGAISPDGSYFVVTSGSGGDRPPISDTAVAYPIDGGDHVEPLWISRLFDSVYSVAISADAVFVGGHFNYMESPSAPDPWPGLTNVGYGRGQGLAGYGLGDDIVIRDHIGALDPATGKAVEWHPGSDSFEGNKAMLVTPRGIVTGGDATTQGGYNVGRIAFYDVASVPAPGVNETTIVFPIEGRVEEADAEFLIGGTATTANGVQRVQLEVLDQGSNQWLQDDLVTWSSSWNGINVNLQSPNAATTVWSQPLTISGNRRIQFKAKTFALNGTNDSTKATKKIETFGLADQTPSTRISAPSGIVPTLTFTVTGTAADDFGVNALRFSLRDAQDRYLQDDGTVDATYNTFGGSPDVIGATEATWSYEVTVPYEGEWTMQAIAVDTAGQADLRSSDRTWLVNATAQRPSVSITSPALVNPPSIAPPITLEPGSPLTFTGSATDDEGLLNVEIRLRNRTTGENLASDGTWGVNSIRGWHRISSPFNLPGSSYNWTYTTPFDLVPGQYDFEVRATDDLDLVTSSSDRGRLTILVQVPGDSPPDARLDVTGTQTGVEVLHLDLTGTATDDNGVAAVRVELYDNDSRRFVQPDGTLASAEARLDATLTAPGATSTDWSLSVDLPTEGNYSVTAYAYDTVGQQDLSTSGATARYVIYPGDNPPTVTENLLTPTEGITFTEARIVVSGRVEDDQQIARAQVAIRNSAGQYMSSGGTFTSTNQTWITAFLNSPGSPGSNFAYTSPAIPDGAYTVLVRAVDQHGFTTPVPSERNVTVTGPAGNLPPVADFTTTCDQNVCTFDARTSTDENAATLTYSWNFGNGAGSGPVPTRTYTSPADYTVTLTATDEYGLTSTTSQTIAIIEPAGNAAPVPVINPPSCALLACNLSSVGSADPDVGDVFTRVWDFGDGTPTSTSVAPSHTFATAGTYVITLTLTDGWGRVGTTTREVVVADT